MGISKKIYNVLRPYYQKVFAKPDQKYLMINTELDKKIKKRVLITGIYLTDYPNQALHLSKQFQNSAYYDVEQKWFAIGKNPVKADMASFTIGYSQTKIPKFKLLNQIISNIDLSSYDLLIISDDDIYIWDNFLDAYISYIESFQLKIAQPARTRYSYYDHQICIQKKKEVQARSTNFVEIGPIFSITNDIFQHVLPFPEESPMGYGLDYIWPVIARKNSFKIGIIDAVPVDHSYRKQGKTYAADDNIQMMKEFLSKYENTECEGQINYEIFYK